MNPMHEPIEWVDGRITKRSADAAKAPEIRGAITDLACTRSDQLEPSSPREKILELMNEIEALKRERSSPYLERLKTELSVSYATNRGFRQKWEAEKEENATLNAALKHEREENAKLNAALKLARIENDDLIELTRSLKERADGLREILKVVADHLEKGPFPLRLPEITDGDLSLTASSARRSVIVKKPRRKWITPEQSRAINHITSTPAK